MNDLLRTVLFLGGLASGVLCGYGTGGRSREAVPESQAVVARSTNRDHDHSPGISRGQETRLAAAPASRLENVFADFARRAAEVGPGEAEALLLTFLAETDTALIPALVDLAADRDPQGCLRALLRIDAANRGDASIRSGWEILFAHWMPAAPDTAMDALLNLPDDQRRRDAGRAGFAALWQSAPPEHERILTERTADLFSTGRLFLPGLRDVPVLPSRPDVRWAPPSENEALRTMNSGSPEARRLAERSRPGELSAADFRRAAGAVSSAAEIRWLAAQPHLAARMALLQIPERAWEYREALPDFLRPAFVRKCAVRAARDAPATFPDTVWLQTLTIGERQAAIEALRMDTTMPPDVQAAALARLEEAVGRTASAQ